MSEIEEYISKQDINVIFKLTSMILTDSKKSLYYFLQMVFPDWDTILNGSSVSLDNDDDDISLGSEILDTLHDNSKIHKLILDLIHYFIKNRNKYDINIQNDNGYTLLYILVWYLYNWKENFLLWAGQDPSEDYPFIFYNPNEPNEDIHNYYYGAVVDNYILNEEELDYYLMNPYLVLYKKKYLSKSIINICIQFKKYIYILLHDKKLKLFTFHNNFGRSNINDIVELINELGDPDIIRWMNKRISKKVIQDIPNVKVSPMKSLYDISKRHAAKVFSSKKDFLMKQNKITRNKYRNFLNIKKQKSSIRRHSSPNSSLFYKKTKTKRRRNTHSRNSI